MHLALEKPIQFCSGNSLMTRVRQAAKFLSLDEPQHGFVTEADLFGELPGRKDQWLVELCVCFVHGLTAKCATHASQKIFCELQIGSDGFRRLPTKYYVLGCFNQAPTALCPPQNPSPPPSVRATGFD